MLRSTAMFLNTGRWIKDKKTECFRVLHTIDRTLSCFEELLEEKDKILRSKLQYLQSLLDETCKTKRM